MPLIVRVPTVLRAHTGGEAQVEADGSTVGEVVKDLVSRFPGFEGHLTTETGDVQKFVNLYLNDEDVRYLDKLDTAVSDGDELSVLPAVAGG